MLSRLVKKREEKEGQSEMQEEREKDRAVILQAESSLVNIVQYRAAVKPLGCLKNAGYLSITPQP